MSAYRLAGASCAATGAPPGFWQHAQARESERSALAGSGGRSGPQLLRFFSVFRRAPGPTGVRHSGRDAHLGQYPFIQKKIDDKNAENDKSCMHLKQPFRGSSSGCAPEESFGSSFYNLIIITRNFLLFKVEFSYLVV